MMPALVDHVAISHRGRRQGLFLVNPSAHVQLQHAAVQSASSAISRQLVLAGGTGVSALRNLGSHALHLLTVLFGEVEELVAHKRHGDPIPGLLGRSAGIV